MDCPKCQSVRTASKENNYSYWLRCKDCGFIRTEFYGPRKRKVVDYTDGVKEASELMDAARMMSGSGVTNGT